MLAHCHGAGLGKVGHVSGELLAAAAGRKGDWRVKIYDKDSYVGLLHCHEVVFTEDEFARLTHLTLQPLRNGTKVATMYANLENAAQTMWRTGSTEHIAMRHLGPIAVVRYWTSVKHNTSWSLGFAEQCSVAIVAAAVFGAAQMHAEPTLQILVGACVLGACVIYAISYEWTTTTRTSLHRIHTVVKTTGAPRAPQGADSDNARDEPREQTKSDQTDPERPPDPPKVADTDNGGNTPADAEVAAGASEDRRTYTTAQGHVAVIGQEFNKDVPHNHQPIVGALIGPCQRTPNVYSKTAENLKSAVKKRITEKQKGCVLSEAEKKRIQKLVQHSMGHDRRRGIFSEARVRKWAEENLHIDDLVSSKWSSQRLKAALEKLWADPEPKFEHKADIKYECMPEGKAPRMLIADGDDGQLMALTVVKCFEDLLFDWMEAKSIKHASKKQAMGRIVKELRKEGGKAIEGDGSAWDTTCNLKIRNLIENPVLYRIMEILVDYGVVPDSWAQEHSKANEKEQLKLFFKNKFETLRITIDSIRRSGHRGTSCLNWWINFVMWVSSVFKAPERFLDPNVRCGEDVTGTKRWWNGVFEGDDSLVVMAPPMEADDALSRRFLKFWADAGFDMKIVFCKKRATVVGWHIACEDGALTSTMCPELPRALANSGVGVSPGTVVAVRDGDDRALRRVAKASALARAADFAGILPSVSNKYYEYARSITAQAVEDREMSMRTFGEEGHGSTEIEEMIISENAAVSPTKELMTLDKLGYGATPADIDRFKTRVWSMEPECLTDYHGFHCSLPPNWRC
jgi:hypothetical protein